MTFALYMMKRLLEENDGLLSESSQPADFRAAVRKAEKELKGSYVKKLYDKFPKIQYSDVEEAFDDAVEEVKKGKERSESATKRAILKGMERNLSGINKKKRKAGKSLSCIKAIKSSLSNGQSISDLMKRAEKILTSQELKVVSMCSEGKPVRKIAEELGTSFPTAWRTLNSAIDKIRVSHGMRPRHLDRRSGR